LNPHPSWPDAGEMASDSCNKKSQFIFTKIFQAFIRKWLLNTRQSADNIIFHIEKCATNGDNKGQETVKWLFVSIVFIKNRGPKIESV
jgi:hypothetical protein